MTKSVANVPRLDMMSRRFKRDLNKTCPNSKSQSNPEFRRIFCSDEKKIEEKVVEKDPRLNFPNSQPCYIISKDKSVWKADPLQCLNNSKYMST